MMNKKGQVLVVFVLILPMILMFLGLVIDIGNSLVIRKKYENIVKDVIAYNYKEIDDEEVDVNLIKKNIKDNIDDSEEIKINVANNILNVKLNTKYKSIFGNMFNIGLNTINIEVKYDIKNKKIVRE